MRKNLIIALAAIVAGATVGTACSGNSSPSDAEPVSVSEHEPEPTSAVVAEPVGVSEPNPHPRDQGGISVESRTSAEPEGSQPTILTSTVPEGWIVYEGDLLTAAYPPGWDIVRPTQEEVTALIDAGLPEGADPELDEVIRTADLSQQTVFFLNDDALFGTNIVITPCDPAISQRFAERAFTHFYEELGFSVSETGETVVVGDTAVELFEGQFPINDLSGVPIEIGQLVALRFLPEHDCALGLILSFRPESQSAKSAFLEFLRTVSFGDAIDASESVPVEESKPRDRGQSRDNPLPIGSIGRVGGWEIIINDVTLDATEIVLAENQFNDPPEPGRQFFIANLSATYVGSEEPASLFLDVSMYALGITSVAYRDFEDSCGVIPNELDSFANVFQGGTITGNVCWSIQSGDANALLLYVEESFSFFDDTRVWWSLGAEDVP